MRFRSFQGRLLTFFIGLLVLVQAGGFLVTNYASLTHARKQIVDSLHVTAGLFQRLLADRNARMLEAGRLLSGDYAFKTAYATGDDATILSMLHNHRGRLGADLMMLLSLDDQILASTRDAADAGRPFPQLALIDKAYDDDQGEAAALAMLDGAAYQLAVLPLLIPHHDGWIVIGFRVDDAFTEQLRALAQSQVTVLTHTGEGQRVLASSFDALHREQIRQAAQTAAPPLEVPSTQVLGGEEFVSLAVPLPAAGEEPLLALLQRSLDEAIRPYRRLQWQLLGLVAVGLALSLLGGVAIARTVSRPVRQLAETADRVAEGDYSQRVEVRQSDEIGRLAESFNAMMHGLAERDRVRNLLGKVVSPAIAEELLSKEIELGGEERVATVMFADIRNFTTLSEARPPREILDLLNTLLTRFSDLIETHGGVVDKYIGDAVMALFGAPLSHADDPSRAVAAALDLSRSLDELNEELQARVGARVDLGIGINTGTVVAGNMGSRKRLNYTVLGDGVNLASRLEGLTKAFGVRVVVSESTMRAAPEFVYRELDAVRVKGRNAPVRIFEPLGREIGEAERLALERHHRALEAYRAQRWEEAAGLWQQVPGKLPQMYLARIQRFREEPPPPDWDGVYTFTEK